MGTVHTDSAIASDAGTTSTVNTEGNTEGNTAGGAGRNSPRALRRRAKQVWGHDLGREERAAILSWGAFTVTFASVRALTHWIRDGHGPASGGLSLGGKHFHHYNLGIAGLTMLGGLLVQAEARARLADHPAIPTAFGVSTALIADEAALLLDLQDVYWSPQGRESVEIATGVIGAGGLGVALVPFAQHFYQRTPH